MVAGGNVERKHVLPLFPFEQDKFTNDLMKNGFLEDKSLPLGKERFKDT